MKGANQPRDELKFGLVTGIGSTTGWGKPDKVAGPARLHTEEATGPRWATRKRGTGG
jgi:hypothetical protein